MSGEPLLTDPWSEKDPRYPGWHQWLSIPNQYNMTYVMYFVFVAWTVIYFLCKFVSGLDPDGAILGYAMFLPFLNYILGTVLLLGMVSKFQGSEKYAFILLTIFAVTITVWPRLAIPGFSMMFGAFFLYVLIYVVWAEDVVHWEKFGVPGYMTMTGLLLGYINMGLFKWWCSGYLPKFVYWNLFMLVMVSTTLKEYWAAKKDGDSKVFDYRVTIPVFERLIAFRLGVLVFALGTLVTFTQEQMIGLLKDDVWECTPMSW